MKSIRRLLVRTEMVPLSFVRPGLAECPMGSAVRDVCMQDPNRLAHWPANCVACNDKMRERSSTRRAGSPR